MCFWSNNKDKNSSKLNKKGLKGDDKKKTVKVLLCGNSYVGKTSITARYREGVFKDTHQPTIAGTYQQKKIKLKTGQQLQFNIWDTAGDQRFRAIMPLYYRDAQIAMLVFDLTMRQSFQSLDYWLKEMDSHIDTTKMVIALIGNKCDLKDARKVTTQQLSSFAKSKKMLSIQTSAKTGQGIDSIFEQCAQQYLKMIK